MIQVENPDIVYQWGIKELWAAINLLEEPEEYEEELKKIKYGIKIQIPIIYIIKGWVTENPENKRISVKGHGKFDIVEFYDEIDEREKLMREIVLEELSDNDVTAPRT